MQIEDDGKVVELHEGGRRDDAPPPSFELFFLEHHDRLYAALFFIVGDAGGAEDIAQEAFLKLWERWDRLDAIDDPTAYLFRTALNGFRMRARRAKVAARHLTTATEPDPFHQIELRADLRELLAKLPARQRAALVLTEIYGYDSAQTAYILGVRASTVRVLTHRARATLRGEIDG